MRGAAEKGPQPPLNGHKRVVLCDTSEAPLESVHFNRPAGRRLGEPRVRLCRLDLLSRRCTRVRTCVRACVRARAGRGVGGVGGVGVVCGGVCGLRRRASATMALEFKKVLAKPLVASEDMTAEMAGETVEIITAAVDKFLSTENYEKAAQAVKDGMDRKFGPTWHCCIGEGFGYDVTYNTRNMLLLYYGEKLGILGA